MQSSTLSLNYLLSFPENPSCIVCKEQGKPEEEVLFADLGKGHFVHKGCSE